MPLTALDHALALADQGIATFPCAITADDRKVPCTPNGFYDASKNPTELRALWRAHPGPLVGARCGATSNLAVLDIDAKHQLAKTWWQDHQQQLRHYSRIHRTRSGGLHILFQHHEAIQCTTGRIAKGVDTRGDGGYAVWWPAAGYPVLHDAPLAAAPDWLLQQLKPREPPPPPRLVIPDDRQIRTLVRYVASAPEGQRNAILYWAANRFRQMLGPDLTEDDAISYLLQSALAAGLLYRGSLATIRSGLRGPRR
jgi:hypothetical protein